MRSGAEILELLHRTSARVLQLEGPTADARIVEILGLVGLHLDATRVSLLRLDPTFERSTTHFRLDHTWSRDAWTPRQDLLDLEAHPWAVSLLHELAPVVLRSDGSSPEATEARELLETLGVGTILAVPSVAHGQLVGLLVLQQVDPAHGWPAPWIDAVRIVGDQLAHVDLRLRAEEATRHSEARFRMFAEASTEGICVHEDGIVLDVNDALSRLVGAPRDSLVGRKVLDHVHPLDREATAARIREGRTGKHDSRLLRGDGTWFWAEVTSREVASGGRRTRLITVRDITTSRETEALLRESEERFRILGESTYDGIAVSDNAVIVQANEPFARMFGYAPEEVVGLTPDDLHTTDSVDRLLDLTEGGGHDANELVGVRRDGSRFPVLVRGRWCRLGGRLVRISGYLDLTERNQAEAERHALEAQVRHAQKLESLGLLAGGIAHDFNNLLVGVLGNAELALLDGDLTRSATSALERIRSAAQRASELTNQMLAYSGKGRFELRPVDVNERIRALSELLGFSHGKSVRLVLDLDPGLAPVEADPAQIDQVVMNLVTNAGDAMGDRPGTIRVATSRRALSADTACVPRTELDAPLPPGTYVVLEVADTGAGMDDSVRQRIFDPFFSTKFTGRGLGLAAVQGIVRGHDGAIEVESTTDVGTTFRVWLPAMPNAQPWQQTPDLLPRGRPGKGRVLVVDDEPQVRDVTQRLLERVGYEVALACDGLEALARLQSAPEAFDAVLLDMTMPGPGGEEVLRRMREVRPSLPVVLCSGYARTPHADPEPAVFLQKPFRLGRLLDALDEAMQTAG